MAENYFKKYPNTEGFFNEYGGAFIPPNLEEEMKKINDAYFLFSNKLLINAMFLYIYFIFCITYVILAQYIAITKQQIVVVFC